MGALDKIAERMYGGRRLETTASLASTRTDTYMAQAVTDSSDGSVSVIITDSVTQPDAYQVLQTWGNISEFLSHDLTDTAYWSADSADALACATQLDEGWASFEGSAVDMSLGVNIAELDVTAGETYTLMVEVRGVETAPNGDGLLSVSADDLQQLHSDGAEHAYADAVYYIPCTASDAPTQPMKLSLCSGNTETFSFQLRVSLYFGEYSGAYQPYGTTEITTDDLSTAVEVPTTVSVKAGDVVMVTSSGAETLTPMVVTGVVGRGDEQQGQIDAATIAADDAFNAAESAEALAEQAKAVAEATGQHFWSDDDGAHVTEVTQEEWSEEGGVSYHSGPNSLWNSLGMLFRNALNNLLALVIGSDKTESFSIAAFTTTYALSGSAINILSVHLNGTVVSPSEYNLLTTEQGISAIDLSYDLVEENVGATVTVAYRQSAALSLYDGNGNDAANIVASFSGTVIELGRNTRNAIIRFCNGGARIRAVDSLYGSLMRFESDSSLDIIASSSSGGTASLSVGADSSGESIVASIQSSGGTQELATLNYDGLSARRVALPSWGSDYNIAATNNGARISKDSYAAAQRIAVINYMLIDNSASDYDGRNASLYIRTDGLQLYLPAMGGNAAQTLWDMRFQTSSLNLTTTNLGGGTKTLYFAKQWRMVTATFGAAVSASAANTTYTVGTIPAAYRPAREAYAYSRGVTNSIVSTGTAAARWTFKTNGTIQVTVGATGAYEHYFTVSWWTAS